MKELERVPVELPKAIPIDLGPVFQLLDDRYVKVIYGLIDPRRPDEVAYVGQTQNHVIERYLQHLRDGLKPNPANDRCRWLAELCSFRTAPGLCVIEMFGIEPCDLTSRESFWIAEYQSLGQAWINRPALGGNKRRSLRSEILFSAYQPLQAVG